MYVCIPVVMTQLLENTQTLHPIHYDPYEKQES